MEAVLLLTKLHVERHIEVDVGMDELDVTAAESKATYNEIRDYVWEHHQLKVSNLYISQVKQKYGIIERENYHSGHNNQCAAGLQTASSTTADSPVHPDRAAKGSSAGCRQTPGSAGQNQFC